MPITPTTTETASESSTPAAANASSFAARNLTRSGAASSELVIVRWRHSPVIPTIARMRMKRLVGSLRKTSLTTVSSVGSLRMADEGHEHDRETDRDSRPGRRRSASSAA